MLPNLHRKVSAGHGCAGDANPYDAGSSTISCVTWEPGAGKIKPKPRPRPRPSAPIEQIIEPDLSREPRSYALTESYSAGDRIAHPTLGTGVVQGEVGPGKIQVLFGEKKSLLVHERVPANP